MRFYVYVFSVAALATAAFVAHAGPAAEATPPAVTASAGAQENLTKLAAKRVTVTLRSGKEIEGTVGEVTKTAVILQALGGGKDFFNAWVRLDDVAAIAYRVK
jgi:hypothetical protein